MSSWQVTLILVSTLSRVKRVFMSIRACLVSLYTVPRKLRGRESWKSRPFTITRSPTVMVPARQQQINLQRCILPTAVVSYVCLWGKKNQFCFQIVKTNIACYSQTLSPPTVISFSASRLFYFLFMPLFHACCALFPLSFYYPVQSEVSFSFPSVHLISFKAIHFFPLCSDHKLYTRWCKNSLHPDAIKSFPTQKTTLINCLLIWRFVFKSKILIWPLQSPRSLITPLSFSISWWYTV